MRKNPDHASGPVAKSHYRQIRITATQESRGSFSYSIYAKPLDAQWHERQCLVRARLEATPHALTSTEDVLIALIAILECEVLSYGRGEHA